MLAFALSQDCTMKTEECSLLKGVQALAQLAKQHNAMQYTLDKVNTTLPLLNNGWVVVTQRSPMKSCCSIVFIILVYLYYPKE